MIKSVFQLLAGTFVLLGICGCTSTATFDFREATRGIAPVYGSSQKTIAVKPFVAAHSMENDVDALMLALLPIWPYGYVINENPGQARTFVTLKEARFQPADFTAGAAAALKRSGRFAAVENALSEKGKQCDYQLSGVITRSTYTGAVITYGISALGFALPLIGLPYGTSKAELAVHFTLTDSTGATLWTQEFYRSDRVVHGYYYNWGRDLDAYPAMMADIMKEAIGAMPQ